MSGRRGRLEQTGQRARTRRWTSERSVGEHGFDRLDAGDRFLGERKTEGDRAQQLSIDIHRAAAHALQNSGFGKGAAAEAGDHDALLGAEILEDTEDFDLELFNAISLKDSPAYSSQSRVDILQRVKLLSVCESE